MIACPHARWFLLALNKHDTTAKMLYFAIVEFQRVLSSMSYHQQYKTCCETGIKTTPGRNRLRAPIHALGKPEAEKIIDYTSLNKIDLIVMRTGGHNLNSKG
jgi:hypothetical protein